MTREELEFQRVSIAVLDAVGKVETFSLRETVLKNAIELLLFKSLENEEVFNDNLEILNKAHAHEISMKRFDTESKSNGKNL